MTPQSFQPHMGILPLAQQRIWTQLQPVQKMGFVLYGGTAIALRLNHRMSVDFDFFSHQPLDKNKLYQTLPFLQQAMVLQDQPDSFTVLVPDGSTTGDTVKISFFGSIDFGRIGTPDITADGVMRVASLDDLMQTKVKVVLQRVEAKDYKDIAAMLKTGVSLGKGLATARLMYGGEFQPSESLKAMVYFKGGDLHTLSDAEKAILVEAVSQVRDLPSVRLASHQLT